MTEEWKPIEGYEGCYEVSNMGRIKSVSRFHNNNGSGWIRKERILKQYQAGACEYYKVDLYQNCKRKKFAVHRLVALAFVENPQPSTFKVVNHKNENRLDNRAINLEWCTDKYNSNYGTAIERRQQYLKNGGMNRLIATRNRNHSYGEEKQVCQMDLCGKTIAIHKSINAARRAIGKPHAHITECCQHKLETAAGYQWCFV